MKKLLTFITIAPLILQSTPVFNTTSDTIVTTSNTKNDDELKQEIDDKDLESIEDDEVEEPIVLASKSKGSRTAVTKVAHPKPTPSNSKKSSSSNTNKRPTSLNIGGSKNYASISSDSSHFSTDTEKSISTFQQGSGGGGSSPSGPSAIKIRK